MVAAKKKRKTFAAKSNESTRESNSEEYVLPSTYKEFMIELQKASVKGDVDSKNAIKQLAPQMATVLIKHNQWFHPDIPFDDIPDNVKIVCDIDDVNALDDHFISELIAHELGPVSCSDACTETTAEEVNDDLNQAFANYLVDIMPTTIDKDHNSSKGVMYDNKGDHIRAAALLKGLQPEQEIPNKNRG